MFSPLFKACCQNLDFVGAPACLEGNKFGTKAVSGGGATTAWGCGH